MTAAVGGVGATVVVENAVASRAVAVRAAATAAVGSAAAATAEATVALVAARAAMAVSDTRGSGCKAPNALKGPSCSTKALVLRPDCDKSCGCPAQAVTESDYSQMF